MKYLRNWILMPLAMSIVISQGVSAGVLENKQVNDLPAIQYGAKVVLDKNIVPKNSLGIRELDLTNPEHEELVYERLKMAGIKKEKFPQLYHNQYVQKEQQLLAKSFKYEENNQKTIQQDLGKKSANDSDGSFIKNAHFFMGMNVGVSELNHEPYLVVSTKSTVFGGTTSTYLDIYLEDENGDKLAPIGTTLIVGEGEDTIATSQISLKQLKQEFPDLDMIYVSSFVETELADGTIESSIKYTNYPFSWEEMDSLYPTSKEGMLKQAMSAKSSLSAHLSRTTGLDYRGSDPTDKNGDHVVKLCLSRNHRDCDYVVDQFDSTNDTTYVNIPFSGTIQFPHEVMKVFATGEQAEGIDATTNIFLQEGVYGGATMQSFKKKDNGLKHFSDYVHCISDKETETSICKWDIPRNEGRFENAMLFSNNAEVDWYISFVFYGKPYFRGRTGTFQVVLTSDIRENYGDFYSKSLPKMKFSYSCLARGTDILMADGSTMAIEDIEAGDMVMGALAKNPETAQPMMVEDVSIGVETIDMYRIHLADGNSILMTETHPISTTNKGIIWSKELEPGDRILTMDESVLVTAVSTESYQDNVFNLKLSPGKDSLIEEGADLGMFANGLLVGDLDTQDEYNYKDQFSMETQEEKLQRMPEKWKTDYLNSLNM